MLEDGSPYEVPGTLQFSEVTVDQGFMFVQLTTSPGTTR
jgi:hypothetical protein